MDNKTFHGKAGISATMILDSISESNVRLCTILVDFPRIVLAELEKHRMFSMSAASSRAIPFEKMKAQLTGMPVRFGKANPGMQDAGEHDAYVYFKCFENSGNDSDCPIWMPTTALANPELAWYEARERAVEMSEAFYNSGYSKQLYNRLTEPFQMIRVLITATEWDNFFWLRNDKAADPTIQELARVMQECLDNSTPSVLSAGQWHLPFVDTALWEDAATGTSGQWFYIFTDYGVEYITLEDAIKVSCARCAATSFRNENYGLEKCLSVYDRLLNGDKIHAGALEHCATPMQEVYGGTRPWDMKQNHSFNPFTWENGISHVTRDGQLWSANFRGFIQHRKTIKGENYVKR